MIFSKALMEKVLAWQERDIPIKLLTRSQMENAIKYLRPKRYERFDEYGIGLSIADMIKLTTVLPKPRKEWVKELGDCDNFAKRLNGIIDYYVPGICFGIVTVTQRGGRHCLNVFIDSQGSMYYLEPQTFKIYTPIKYTQIFGVTSVDNILL